MKGYPFYLVYPAIAFALGAFTACGSPLPASSASRMTEPSLTGKCQASKRQMRPLIVEWPSSDRATLEARMHRGLVPIHYQGCTIEVLARCEAKGNYVYTPITPKFDRVTMHDSSELYANVPLGAASLEGKLAQAGALNVEMTVVGRYENEKMSVRADQLQGDCARATHVVTAITTGAFEFFAGASEEAGANARVAMLGSGGVQTKSSKESLNRDGEVARCQGASSGDARPPEGCSALLRIEVAPIGEAAPPTCPEGSTFNGAECVRSSVLTVTECPAGTRWDGHACLKPEFPVQSPSPATVAFGAPPAESPPPLPNARFALVAEGVQDGRSGLLWAKSDAPRRMTWQKAREHCARQGLRLPTQQELSELVGADPSVGALGLARSQHYWSSSQFSAGSSRYYAVNVVSGETRNEWDDDSEFLVRCVSKLK